MDLWQRRSMIGSRWLYKRRIRGCRARASRKELEGWWRDRLSAIPTVAPAEPPRRSVNDMMAEVLELSREGASVGAAVRDLHTQMSGITGLVHRLLTRSFVSVNPKVFSGLGSRKGSPQSSWLSVNETSRMSAVQKMLEALAELGFEERESERALLEIVRMARSKNLKEVEPGGTKEEEEKRGPEKK